MQIKVKAIMAYGEGFTYRIEDAKGASFNIMKPASAVVPRTTVQQATDYKSKYK